MWFIPISRSCAVLCPKFWDNDLGSMFKRYDWNDGGDRSSSLPFSAPRMGVTSHGMVLCAKSADKKVRLVKLDRSNVKQSTHSIIFLKSTTP